MSAKATGTVWETSHAKGSNLLVLLAIADVADEQGRNAWPSPEHLARKTRMSARAMRLILHKLEREGELIVELNHDRRQVKKGYTPPFFLHVRCVFDAVAYEAAESENFTETPFVSGRRPTGKDRQLSPARNRKRFQGNRKSEVLQPEKSGSAYKEDPSVDPLVELQAGAAPPPAGEYHAEHADETPDDNLGVITKLAHEVFDLYDGVPDLTVGEVVESVKARCAALGIGYWPGDVIDRAIASAHVQRQRAGKRAVLTGTAAAAACRLQEVS